MAEPVSSSLYEEVVTITHYYFGPAARRFVDRQIASHLGKDPEKLLKKDLNKLADWMGLAMALLIEDEAMVNNFSADMRELISR